MSDDSFNAETWLPPNRSILVPRKSVVDFINNRHSSQRKYGGKSK